ncbi:MAG: penicillin acylase family protein [Candidatus Koribacter versatilis]|uniref:Penicillin acylase family protein n=1 Tax=Candidatus Korobacter versatilis TaxID=658062 RepID=A0A932A6F9_9BACT|nr:penicillin acylase family protein [Candidatus Koribacter versatilis]
MATPTLAPARPRVRRIVLRIASTLLLIVLLASAGVATWFYSVAHASLPQLDGKLALRGLSAPVTVTRDHIGVPHIVAATDDDLFFAQGFVTAQDRLWQMDINRRFAAGEMSEVFGAAFFGADMLKLDRAQRTLMLRPVAQRALAALPARERSQLEAYARGVNALIEQQRARHQFPIEFRLLGYEPKVWTAEDCMVVVLNLVESLNHGYYADDLARERVAAKVPAELLKDLYPTTSWRDHPPTARSKRISPDEPPANEDDPDDDSAVTRLRHWLVPLPIPTAQPEARLVPGSNDWVVSGAYTVSGKPLLSNDMHLEHHIPNVWYEAHLELSQPIDGRQFNAAGVTVPGFPYIIAGHNQRIAWGYTNLGPDVEDVYIEDFNAGGEYRTPQGWQKPEHLREAIKVKHAPDVTLDVVVTRHGPIITALVPEETRKLALRWNIYDPKLPPSLIYWDLNTATDWTEFRAAWSRHVAPALNVVYADVDGHIGYQATGMIPIRNGWDGNLPVSGADDTHEWSGNIPFAELPQVYDPESGILATANARITPDGYKYMTGNQWFPPYRQERIYRMLGAGRKFAPADMLALQMDVYSDYDHFIAERIVYAIDHARNPSDRARKAADILRAWDGRVTPDSVAPVLTGVARRYLWQALLEGYLGPPDAEAGSTRPKRIVSGVYKEYSWGMQSAALETLLMRRPQRWLPKGTATWDDLIATALEHTVSDKDAPRDLRQWTWGQVLPVVMQHPLFGTVPVLSHWSGPGMVPQAGNAYTVKAAGRGFGASQRSTIDMANLDDSLSNIVTGQSGQIFSSYYMDQWRAWSEGGSFPLPFSRDAVRHAAAHTLTLEPAR